MVDEVNPPLLRGAITRLVADSRRQSPEGQSSNPRCASLRAKKALRRGLDVARGSDILWTLNHPDTWLLLVGARDWRPEQYERWLVETSCEQLLVDP